MPMRVTGLTSGLDTESIVSALVSAYNVKTQKYTKAQTKLSWTQEAWKGLNTKVYSLYTNLSNLRFSGAYTTKKASVSDATKASVSASGTAVNGTQKLKINSTAQSAYMTGGKIALTEAAAAKELPGGKKNELSLSTTLGEIGYIGRNTSFQLTAGGKTTQININSDTKLTDIVASFKEAGVNVNLDTNQGRLYLNAKTTGKDGNFSITPTEGNADSLEALYTLGLASADAMSGIFGKEAAGDVTLNGQNTGSSVRISFAEPASTAQAEEQNFLLGTLRLAREAGTYSVSTDASGNASYHLDGYVFENGKIYRATDTERQNAIASYEENGTLQADSADSTTDIALTGGGQYARYRMPGVAAGNVNLKTANSNADITFSFAEPTSAKEAEQQNALTKLLKKNGGIRIDASQDASTGEVSLSYRAEGYIFRDGKVYAEGDEEHAVASYRVNNPDELVYDPNHTYDQKASITATGGSEASFMDYSDTDHIATMIVGKDAEIELNGVVYTSNTNDFSINGLNIKALAVTDGEIDLTTDSDTQAIYDKIKDFLTEYNSIINEMTKLYNAESSHGYEPLTDEEKDAMSDTEIEKWETKIKESLLRRDSTLNGVMSAMVNAMGASYEIDGKKYSLSTFGIMTMGYLNSVKNENYAYHINGDPDDENTSGNEDKLMKAITEDPDSVIEFMKKLTANLYTSLGDKMKSTSLSSAYTIYNDKEMTKQYADYTKTINDWKDKLTEKEDYYYRKFSKMESAMAKLQAQTSSLTGMFTS